MRRLFLSSATSTLGVLPRLLRRLPFFRRLQIDSGPSRFGQADGDGLLGRTSAMLSFSNVVHLLADELACLS